MDCVIVGNGDYARMLKRYIERTTDNCIVGYTVKREFMIDSLLDGITVIPADEMVSKFGPNEYLLYMGIGYRNMHNIRANEYNYYKLLGFMFNNYIHPTAIIEDNVKLGEGNNIFEGVIIEDKVEIGNANLCYGGALIGHESKVGNFNTFAGESCLAGCVLVKDHCFVGVNSTVRDHVILNSYTLVGASAYISEDTEEYDVIVAPKAVKLDGRKSTEFV